MTNYVTNNLKSKDWRLEDGMEDENKIILKMDRVSFMETHHGAPDRPHGFQKWASKLRGQSV